MLVTIAVKSIAVVGLVESTTVRDVAVEAVTVPTAPSLKTTELLAAVASNPKPLMVNVVTLAARSDVTLVSTGMTVATCTASPFITPLIVTRAVKLPAEVGAVDRLTVSTVDVAAVTVPTAPLLNVTILLAAMESNPTPLIVMLLALAGRLADSLATTTGTTDAICTPELPVKPLLMIVAVRFPDFGLVMNVIASEVAVDAVTTPVAPLLKVTTFLDAIGSNPNPLIVSVLALANRLVTLLVRTGVTTAT